MKFALSVAKTVLIFAVACALLNVEVVPLWGSWLASLAVSASISGMLVMGVAVVLIALFVFVGAVVGALVANEDAAKIGGCLGLVLVLPFVFAFDIFVLYNGHNWIQFYPNFGSVWNCVVISFVDSVVGIMFTGSISNGKQS